MCASHTFAVRFIYPKKKDRTTKQFQPQKCTDFKIKCQILLRPDAFTMWTSSIELPQDIQTNELYKLLCSFEALDWTKWLSIRFIAQSKRSITRTNQTYCFFSCLNNCCQQIKTPNKARRSPKKSGVIRILVLLFCLCKLFVYRQFCCVCDKLLLILPWPSQNTLFPATMTSFTLNKYTKMMRAKAP